MEWKLTTATVTYDGQTKRRQMPLPVSRGERFLPLQLTELATGPTRALTRHFIEVFVWLPSGKAGPWKLQWLVFEVVRDEIITVGVSDSLTTAEGDAPPRPEIFDPVTMRCCGGRRRTCRMGSAERRTARNSGSKQTRTTLA